MSYAQVVINLLKCAINGTCTKDMADKAQIAIAKAIDRCKVYNQPSGELETLYGQVMWLKCDILKY